MPELDRDHRLSLTLPDGVCRLCAPRPPATLTADLWRQLIGIRRSMDGGGGQLSRALNVRVVLFLVVPFRRD